MCTLVVYYTISHSAVCLAYYKIWDIVNIFTFWHTDHHNILCCILLILTIISMVSALHYDVWCSFLCRVIWLCCVLYQTNHCAWRTTKYGTLYIVYSHFDVQNIIYSVLRCILLILTVRMLSALHYTIVYSTLCGVLGALQNLGHCV